MVSQQAFCSAVLDKIDPLAGRIVLLRYRVNSSFFFNLCGCPDEYQGMAQGILSVLSKILVKKSA
ncbi:hypothetical protein Q4595_20950, partial [Wenyingzhuangia sp. 1_MG-2023]|nr:hypothetical protein [Wenyingzhuangia sp. 1_MG-2023]